MASDNSAVISCESILAILDHEGCEDLSRLSSSDYIFPAYSDLDPNISKIQMVKRQREAEGAEDDSSKIADIAGSSGTKDTGGDDGQDSKALVVARPVLDVPPMNIICDGVIVPGSAWERYSFAHPGASVSKKSLVCQTMCERCNFASIWMMPIL
ncbi:hypothetical protein C2845_PM10G10230 [Panicum miliaceum]|uniref:Uncharacterized protein n=1 Tax=Panicum miliaceum TaxID=4540 RepID=A0A3L6PFJ8_PANMI|nr:hypothetical protein C2845_PM10G10230 [Panicum miliaceum]